MMNESSAVAHINAYPNDIPAARFLARVAMERKEYNLAANFYTRIVRQGADAEAFQGLGDVYRAIEKPVAMIYYQRAFELQADTELENKKHLTTLIDSYKKVFLDANSTVKALLGHVKQSNIKIGPSSELKQYLQVIERGDYGKAYAMGNALYKKNQLDPKMLPTWGSAAARSGEIKTGLAAALLGVWFEPSNWMTIVNLADIFIQLHQPVNALDFAVAAVNLSPFNATTWTNLGAANDIAQRPWESEKASRKALEINPNNAAALTNLGNALKNSGRSEEAAHAYEKAMELAPENPMFRSNYLFGIQYADDVTPDKIALEHRKFGELFEKQIPETKFPKHRYDAGKKRLRVGFVSADFRSHPVAYFLEPLWLNLDKEKFDIYAYYTFKRADIVTARLKPMVSTWRDVAELGLDAMYKQLIDDELDIVVDMVGHTGSNRLLVFARRAAPVQVTWLGHPNTTGLTRMDWRFTDHLGDPVGVDHRYTEKLWRLPVGAAYASLGRNPEKRGSGEYAVQPTPALKNGYITFGTCNNVAKLSDRCIKTWAEILKKMPTSRLFVESPGISQPELKNHLMQRFASHGVAPDRIDCYDRDGKLQYLRYNCIDIALDPFPYNGGTTSVDTLWMGVPLVCLIGDTCMGRSGYSIVGNLGFGEWAANCEGEYVDNAVNLAEDVDRLNRLRQSIRPTMEKSLLMNGPAFANSVEDAFDKMWLLACRQAHCNAMTAGDK